MADLNVQRKRRAPVWPWILLLLIIAAVAYFILRDKGAMTDDNDNDNDTTMVQPVDTASQYRTDTVTIDTVPVR